MAMDGSAAARWRGGGRDREDAGPVLAALDLGTNNCRLLVARPEGNGFRVIDAFSRIVRLGEGLSASSCLSEAAMERTVEALRVCAAKMRRRQVSHARYVATEACRQARNCAAFLARVRDETGIEIEIISTQEEAELAFAGCWPLLDRARKRALVFDIGGGSTELGWLEVAQGTSPTMVGWLSVPLGVVPLSERYGSGRIEEADYAAMVAAVRERMAPFAALHRWTADAAPQMLGTSGTVTTLAGVHMNLARYDRSVVDGSYLDFDDIRRVSRSLAAMDFDERAALACIGSERADLVVAGCAILEAICELWPCGRVRVADRGVREGILNGLLEVTRRETGFTPPQ